MSDGRVAKTQIDTSELLYLIVEYLRHNTALQQSTNELIHEINIRQLLPPRIDWRGNPHASTVEHFAQRYAHIDTSHRLPLLLQELLTRCAAPSLLSDIVSGSAPPARPRDLPAVIRTHQKSGLQAIYSQLRRVKTFCGHGHPVYCVAFDAVGARLVTGSDDMNLKVWSLTSGALFGVLRGHKSCISDASISPDNKLVAAGAVDGSIRVWQLDTCAPVAVLLGHKTSINSVAFSPCGRYLLSSALGGIARVWRTDTDFETLPTLVFDDNVQRPHVNRTLSNAINAAALMHAALFLSPQAPGGAVASSSVAPGGGAHGGAPADDVQSFAPSVNAREPPIDDPATASTSSAISLFGLGGTVFAVVGYPTDSSNNNSPKRDNSDHEADTSSEPIGAVGRRRRDRLAAAAASSNRGSGQAPPSQRKKNVVRLFNLDLLSSVCELVGHTDEISALRFPSNPTRAMLCSGSDDGTVRVWSFGDAFRSDATPAAKAAGWRVVSMADVPRAGRVNTVVWALDDQRVIGVHEDSVIRIWDSNSGALLHSLQRHTDDVFTLAVNPVDSSVILSGGHDGVVVVWDVLNGVALNEFKLNSDMPAGSRVLDGSFSPTGQHLCVSTFFGEAIVFGLGPQPDRLYNRYPTEQFLPDETQPLIYDNFGWCVDAQTRIPPHSMPRRHLIDFGGAGYDAAVYQVLAPPPFVATEAHSRRLEDRATQRSAAASRIRRDYPGLWGSDVRVLVDTSPPPAPRWSLTTSANGNVGLRVTPAQPNNNSNNAAAVSRVRPTLSASTQRRNRGRPRRNDYTPVVYLPTPPTSDEDQAVESSVNSGEFEDEEESDEAFESDVDDDEDRPRRRKTRAAPNERHVEVHRELPQRAARRAVRTYQLGNDDDEEPYEGNRRSGTRRRNDDEDEYGVEDAVRDDRSETNITYPEWLKLGVPPAAPGAYFPQRDDQVVYFPQGHYEVMRKFRWKKPPDMPVWITSESFPSALACRVRDCAYGRENHSFYIDVMLEPLDIEPGAPALARSTMVANIREAEGDDGGKGGKERASSTSVPPSSAVLRTPFVVRHVPMCEFECLVLRAHVERGVRTVWSPNLRVRSYFHDSKTWSNGVVLNLSQGVMEPAVRATVDVGESIWHCVQVQWDLGNAIENMSPWEIEPVPEVDDVAAEAPLPVDALPDALRAALLRLHGEPRGNDVGEFEWIANSRTRLLHSFDMVCADARAAAFVGHVDTERYEAYTKYVPLPMCVQLMRDRIASLWYRRRDALIDDMDKLVVASCLFNTDTNDVTFRAALVRQMCFAALDISTPTDDYDGEVLGLVVPALSQAAVQRQQRCDAVRSATKTTVQEVFASSEHIALAFVDRYQLNIVQRPRHSRLAPSHAASQRRDSQRSQRREHQSSRFSDIGIDIEQDNGSRPRRAAASAAIANGFGEHHESPEAPVHRDHSLSGRTLRIPARLHPGSDGATLHTPQRSVLRDETRAQFAARTNVIRIPRSAISTVPSAASVATAATASTISAPVLRTRSSAREYNEDAQMEWALQQSLAEAGGVGDGAATAATSSKASKSKRATAVVKKRDDDDDDDDDGASEEFRPKLKKKSTKARRRDDSSESFHDDDDDDDNLSNESEEEAVSSGPSRSKRAASRTRRNYALDDDVSGTVSSDDDDDGVGRSVRILLQTPKSSRGRGRPRKYPPPASSPLAQGSSSHYNDTPTKRRRVRPSADDDDEEEYGDGDDDADDDVPSKRKAAKKSPKSKKRAAPAAKSRLRRRNADGSDEFEP